MSKHRAPRTLTVEDAIAVLIGAIIGLIGFSLIMSDYCTDQGGDGFIAGQCVTIDKEVPLWH